MNRAPLIALLLLSAVSPSGFARRRAVGPATPQIIDLAGSRLAGAVDGPAASARFSSPRGVAFDALTQSIVVADTANHTIRRILNGEVTTIAGAALQAGITDGAAGAARFRLPHGLAVDANGRIWICDTGNHAIRRLDRDGTVSTIAGAAGSAGDADGAPRNARFRFPEGIAIESDGSVIVADTGNHRVRRLTSDAVTTIATATPLRSPSGVAVGRDGTLYVAERDGDSVRVISPGGGESAIGGVLRAPASVVLIGTTGYVADSCNQRVRRLSSGESVIDRLLFPYGLATGNGDLLIADSRHHAIVALRGLR